VWKLLDDVHQIILPLILALTLGLQWEMPNKHLYYFPTVWDPILAMTTL